MPITYPLALPNGKDILSATVTPRSVVAATRSPFTNEAEVLVHPGQWLEARVQLRRMDRADFAPWGSWKLKLNGREGTFTMGLPDLATPRGAAAATPGTPLVKGAAQTGAALAIDGAPLSTANYLKAGDVVQLGSGATARLYMVLNDASSDAAGNVTLDIWPKITAANSPADNAPVVVSNAVGLWRMADNLMDWDVDQAAIYGLSFAAISEA